MRRLIFYFLCLFSLASALILCLKKQFVDADEYSNKIIISYHNELLNEWLVKGVTDKEIKFAVKRLSMDELDLIKDEVVREKAKRIKKQLDCKKIWDE